MQPLKYGSLHQNANAGLMIALLILTGPKGAYKDNEPIGISAKCMHVDDNGCVCVRETGLL